MQNIYVWFGSKINVVLFIKMNSFWLRKELKESLYPSVRPSVRLSVTKCYQGLSIFIFLSQVSLRSLLFQVCLQYVSGLFRPSLSAFLAYFIRQTELKIFRLVLLKLVKYHSSLGVVVIVPIKWQIIKHVKESVFLRLSWFLLFLAFTKRYKAL